MTRQRLTLLALSMLVLRPAMSQRDDARVLQDMRTRRLSSMNIGKVRYELVDKDLGPAIDPDLAMLRVSKKAGDLWSVRILSAEGLPLMTGTYSDDRLTVADGRFIHYHYNGRIESVGMYVRGVKRGTWFRFDPNGRQLAERVYGEHDRDTLELRNGWSTVTKSR